MSPIRFKLLLELILLVPLLLMAAVLALVHNLLLLVVRFLHQSFVEVGKIAKWIYERE